MFLCSNIFGNSKVMKKYLFLMTFLLSSAVASLPNVYTSMTTDEHYSAVRSAVQGLEAGIRDTQNEFQDFPGLEPSRLNNLSFEKLLSILECISDKSSNREVYLRELVASVDGCAQLLLGHLNNPQQSFTPQDRERIKALGLLFLDQSLAILMHTFYIIDFPKPNAPSGGGEVSRHSCGRYDAIAA